MIYSDFVLGKPWVMWSKSISVSTHHPTCNSTKSKTSRPQRHCSASQMDPTNFVVLLEVMLLAIWVSENWVYPVNHGKPGMPRWQFVEGNNRCPTRCPMRCPIFKATRWSHQIACSMSVMVNIAYTSPCWLMETILNPKTNDPPV